LHIKKNQKKTGRKERWPGTDLPDLPTTPPRQRAMRKYQGKKARRKESEEVRASTVKSSNSSTCTHQTTCKQSLPNKQTSWNKKQKKNKIVGKKISQNCYQETYT